MNEKLEEKNAGSDSPVDRLVMCVGDWIKPTTRLPERGEIVAIKSGNKESYKTGYFTGDEWNIQGLGRFELPAVFEWAEIKYTYLHT